MNKVSKIIISILVVLCIFFILMAQIQRNEAEKQVATAIALQKEVIEQSELVKEHKSRSERLTADAIEANAQAEEFKQELLKCQSGK